MNSLFSVFDPNIGGLSLNWVSVMLPALLIPSSFWVSKAQHESSWSKVKFNLYKEFKSIPGQGAIPGFLWLGVGSFFYIWVNNFFGLFPYVFTATSHLSLALSLAMPLWVGHVSLAWIKTPDSMFAHLVPLGSPLALAPFMVLIELISAIIRPVTLSVRLAANMVAGHLLMALLSGPASSGSGLALLVICLLIPLVTLEAAVATIQSYVFSILSVLYISEVTSPEMAK